MKDWLVPYLRCPACTTAVALDGADRASRGEIAAGTLRCLNVDCGISYPIRLGIPRLLHEASPADDLTRRIQRNFGFEWTKYARFGWDDPDYDLAGERRVFHRKALFEAGELAGGVVLDAGCGNGRYSHWAAAYGARVIGIDISDAVDAAAANTAALPNVQIVQADLFNPPLAPQAFDAIFSIGTLMCTGHARHGVASLAPLLKRGGRMSVHVYGKGNAIYEAIDRGLRLWTTRLSLPALERFTARAFRLRGRLQRIGVMKPLGRFIRLDAHPHCIFDWYAAPAATHHTYDEVRHWFREAGLDVDRTCERPSTWRSRARHAVAGSPEAITVRGVLTGRRTA